MMNQLCVTHLRKTTSIFIAIFAGVLLLFAVFGAVKFSPS